MYLASGWKDYEVLDAGGGEKLERWGDVVLRRPDPQAIWAVQAPEMWNKADAVYHRSKAGGGEWEFRRKLPERWQVSYGGNAFYVRPTGFKHTGLFPEQAVNWDWMAERIRQAKGEVRVLNLFGYTGGATLAARAAGAETTHVDSVRQVVTWARENMELSGLDGVRWIVEDAMKFVRREVRRGSRYDAIVLDPPAYGRGTDGEKWILEEHIGQMLACCAQLLSPDAGAFVVLNLYSMGLSAMLARTAVRQAFGTPADEQYGELYFEDPFSKQLPLGIYYRFTR